MTVDAHHHLWDLDVRDQAWMAGPAMGPIRRNFGPADLRAAISDSTVDATVLVQTVSDPEETPEMLELADSVGVIQAVTGWVDLTAEDVRERIDGLLAHPAARWLKGIRHQVEDEPDPEWLCRPDVRAGLAVVQDAGLLYELLVLPHQLPAATRVVSEFPQLTFVLDHCAKPPIASGESLRWAEQLRAIAAHPNVSCKLSGLVTQANWTQWTVDELRPYWDVVLDAFGPDRLMFGSDWPVCLLAAGYGEVLDTARELAAGLTESERVAVFEDTSRRIYRLPAA